MYTPRSRIAMAAALAAVVWLAAARTALAGPAEDDYAIAAEHYSQQRYPAAASEFRKFLRNHKQHVLAANSQFFLAESLHQQGDYAAAGEEFAHFTAEYPEHRFAAQAGFRQGETAYLRGDYAAARPKLAGFVAAHPRDKLCEFAWPYLGDIELELGDFPAAQKAYGQALKSYPAGPLAAECRLGLGRAAEALNDPEEARRFYQFLADRNEHELSQEAQLRLGRLLYQTRDYVEANNYLRPLADSKAALPQRTPARYWLGLMLSAQGKRDDACKVWRQALEQDAEHPLAPTVCLAWADALRGGGDFKSASEQYERLVKSWPRSDVADDALLAQLELAIDAKQWTEADTLAQQFERAYATSPLKANAQAAQAHGWLQQARFAEAMVVLKELSRTDSPRRLQRLYWLALAQLGAKEYAAALETIASLEGEKLSTEVQAGMLATEGIALVALKRPEEALVPLNTYIAQYPQGADLPRCRAQLCIALAQLGRFDAATAAWRDYYKAHAEHPALLPTTLYMAEAAYGARQTASAKELFEWLAQEQQPAEYRTPANAALAWLEQSANEPAKVVAKLDRVLNDRPATAQAAAAVYAKAQNLEKLGEQESALGCYLELIEKHPESLQLPAALLAAARLHDERDQDREADLLLARLVKDHAKFEHLDTALYQWAWVLIDLKRETEAAERLTRLHDEFKDSRFWADGTYRLAELKLRKKQLDDASRLLSELIAAKPADDLLGHVLYLQGQVAATQHKWDDVSPPLNRLVTEFPQSQLRVMAEYWLAEADYRTGKLQQAGTRLADLSTRVEGQQEAWIAMIPLRQAQVLAHEKRWNEAEAIASTIAQKYPEFRQQYEADYLLGRCLGAQAKFSAARDAYERVVRSPVGGRTETAAMAQWMIGETYFQQEKYDDAVQAYHRVERLFAFPRWQAAALLQAGKCHETQGHWREAIQLYAQVLKEHPQTTFAGEASQRLRVAEQRASGIRLE